MGYATRQIRGARTPMITQIAKAMREAAEACIHTGSGGAPMSAANVLAVLDRLAEAERERDSLDMTNAALGRELAALADTTKLADQRDALSVLLKRAGEELRPLAASSKRARAILAEIEAATKVSAE